MSAASPLAHASPSASAPGPARVALTCAWLVLALSSAPSEAAATEPSEGEASALGIPKGDFTAGLRDGALSRVDGELWALGVDYKAHFTAGRTRFVPVLGRDAPRTFPLTFELESIRRGGLCVHAADRSVEPRENGLLVEYRRGGGITERYAVRGEGLEQSFLFAEPLPGSGDLVVRGRLEVELTASSTPDGGLDFVLPDGGRFSYGAVTGIDAAGRRAAGFLRLNGQDLELVLPGDFVDGAAYPLLLDPLIGSVLTVSPADPSDDQFFVDVAYEPGTSRYLVVWLRWDADPDRDVLGQRVSAGGALVGGPILIQAGAGFDGPRVASCRASGRFFVVWDQPAGLRFDIVGRAVNASDGFLSPPITIDAAQTVDARNPDVAGEATSADDDVLVVWQQDTGEWGPGVGNCIRARQVAVPDDGGPFPSGPVVHVSNDADDRYPRVSQSGGGSGRVLVTWARLLAYPGGWDVRGRVLDRNANPLTPQTAIAHTGASEMYPECDGDGNDFLVAFGRQYDSPEPSDVACRRVSYAGGQIELGGPAEVLVNNPENWVSTEYGLAFTGTSYVFAWRPDPASAVRVRTLDPLTCETCAPEEVIENSRAWTLAIASEHGGAPGTGDRVLIAWSNGADYDGRSIRAHRYRDDAATSTYLGGPCGQGGTASVDCLMEDHTTITHRLSGAPPNTPVVHLFGLSELNEPCFPCVLVPEYEISGLATGRTTSASGGAKVEFYLASGVMGGLEFFDQWIVFDGSPSCSIAGGDLSTAIRVEVP